MVQHNMILHTALYWLSQNINQHLNSHKNVEYTSMPWVYIVRFYRKLPSYKSTTLYHTDTSFHSSGYFPSRDGNILCFAVSIGFISLICRQDNGKLEMISWDYSIVTGGIQGCQYETEKKIPLIDCLGVIRGRTLSSHITVMLHAPGPLYSLKRRHFTGIYKSPL